MKWVRRASWTAAALAVLCGALSGCGGSSSVAKTTYDDPHPVPTDTMGVVVKEPGTYGGRFVIAQPSGPRTFNAIMANETSLSDITDRLFIGLADYDNGTQGDYPLLAKSYESSPDGLTWTWHLRRGAAFSDGHPITSADVLFSFEVCYDDSLHPSIQDLLKLDGQRFQLSAPDSYTVVITIPRPYAMMVPACGSVKIMPKHVLESAYRSGGFAAAYSVSTNPDSIVTSGPFRLRQYVAGEKTVVTRNPYWFGYDQAGHRLPYLDEIVYLIVPDQDSADLKFRAREVDGIDDVKPENYKWYEDNQQAQDFTLYDLGPGLNTNFFWFNLNKVRDPRPGKKLGEPYVGAIQYSWFSNRDFRHAVSMAIDREAMIRSVFFGQAVKNWSIVTPGNKVWHSPDTKKYDYDPEGAKKLLDGLGWVDKNGDGIREDSKGNKITFSLLTNSSNKIRVTMANFIRDDLGKIGIECTPNPAEFNTLITHLRQDFQYETILLGLQSATPPDPGMGQNVYKSSGLTHYWNIKQPRPETAAEAKIDQLIAQNIGTNDMAVRKATYRQIEDLIAEEGFVVFLPILKPKLPVRNRFGNLEPSVVPHRLLWNIDRVFVKKSRA